jgi:hypothetical protein
MHKRKAGQAGDLQMAVLDPGVTDKRLLLVEEEFGRLLTVAARTGNTLSSTLRKAWDGNQWLHVEGKTSPEKVTGAHVSMIGHVTLPELLQCLSEIEFRRSGTLSSKIIIATTAPCGIFSLLITLVLWNFTIRNSGFVDSLVARPCGSVTGPVSRA